MKHILGTNSRSTLTKVQQKDIQPNAVDLRLDKVFKIFSTPFELSEDHKKHRDTQEIFPDGEGYFTLWPGDYEVVMENIINVGTNEAGWVITRSTLNRNGCFLTSGLYDDGYSGVMAAVLHVGTGSAKIKKGTRIGQYLSFESESLGKYNGSYGFDETGKPKQDELKYHS